MKSRIKILFYAMLVPFLLYGGYLFYLQVVQGYFYSQISEQLIQRTSRVPAMRGTIYERNYQRPLAHNELSFEVYAVAREFPEEAEPFARSLAELLEEDTTDSMQQQLLTLSKGGAPRTIAKHVPKQKIFFLAEHQDQFPGVHWREASYRVYPYAMSLAHILGYVGDITREEYQVLYNQGYAFDSEIGKSGIEFWYDQVLRGKEGIFRRSADAKGRTIEHRRIIHTAEPGNDLVLTIDHEIQELAEKALGNRDGAVIVMDPENGEILSMVSYPHFDPNIFSFPGSTTDFTDLSLNARSPFINRAIQTAVAPASTFKIAVAEALLKEEDFSPSDYVHCAGSKLFGDRLFHCWDERGHGYVNLKEAIAQSCNIYFYTMGSRYLSPELISDTAYALGLGRKAGIDLRGEHEGFLPSSEWKRLTKHEPWQLGDTVNMSIGQGYVQVTPLQLAMSMAVISNGGYAYRPHLLKETRDHFSGTLIQATEPEIELKTSSEHFVFLQEALREVITHGTAKVVITTDAVDIAGKTGTGQISSSEEGYTSWFMAYAPYLPREGQRRIVVVVMVDGTNEWEWWAPKAANIIFEGIYTDASYEEAVEQLRKEKRLWYM